ncbi:MAG TPA: hypothetical protein VFG20_05680 [Planctomycetaceae bacterium]|jgi:hypothetical protein|nr:hypothetical protein [Planctomycetaceae bacterium]
MLLADVLRSTGDDQVAILGGLAAMFLAGGVMYFSYFLGPEARQQRAARKLSAGKIAPASPIRRDRAA